jgi:NAD+ kinase
VKKLADKIQRVGIIANPEKQRCRSLVKRVAQVLRSAKRVVECDPDTLTISPVLCPRAHNVVDLARLCDLLLVVGGDGTMLRVAREIAGSPTPILGVNAGNLGFLTSIRPDRLSESLNQVIRGQFILEERALLEATVEQESNSSVQIALNDFVLSRGITSRLIELEVSVNGELLTRYRCDGFIASSPTGSTAYSLAAGGAIVSPDTEALTLTPICPHTLSIRPVVVSLQSTVCVRLVSTRLNAILAADGQLQTELSPGNTVTIRRSARSVKLLRLKGGTFFSTLRQKFGWSGSNV